jgi:hypothetical protein
MVVERRKHMRFGLVGDPVAVAFVTSSSPDFVVAGRVTDIGDGGLALSHFGGRLPHNDSLELDIILPGGISATKRSLRGNSIWDITAHSESRARRCGIRFRNLTDDQKALVEYLIRNHTTAAAES